MSGSPVTQHQLEHTNLQQLQQQDNQHDTNAHTENTQRDVIKHMNKKNDDSPLTTPQPVSINDMEAAQDIVDNPTGATEIRLPAQANSNNVWANNNHNDNNNNNRQQNNFAF